MALLTPLIGGSLNTRLIGQQFGEVLRLASSIKTGTVTASLILRKLGAYPRQNSLARALREVGRLERTLFTLRWLRDPALCRRTNAELNKGEARNALARAGGLRDRALLLYGFAGAFRRAELVGLDVSDLEAHPRGQLVTIRRSKTDHAAQVQTVAVLAQPGSPWCPVAALAAWQGAAGIHRRRLVPAALPRRACR